MRKAPDPAKPVPMTVGALISELCRWPDHAEVTFRISKRELRFDRVVGRSKKHIEIEFEKVSESPPIVPA
jgi:hypothetical protein